MPLSTPEALPPVSPAPSEQPPQDRAHRSALLIVFLVVFIDLFGFGIVLPLLPRYGKDFIPGGEHASLAGPLLGLLMASFSAMQFIFAPVWGRLSDRVGRRPILLMGLGSSVIFYSLFGVASLLGYEGQRETGLVLLFVSRIGAGIAGATLGTAQAVIADSTTPERRSRGMALIGAAFGIGFFFGPLLGFGALYLFPGFYAGPGFLAAGLSLVALVLGILLLPETLRPGLAHGRRHWLAVNSLRTVIRTPQVGLLILIFFLATLAFANFEPTLALLTSERAFGLDDRNNFLLFAYVGLVLALAQGLIYRPLAQRVREVRFVWIGTVLMALGLAGIGVVAVRAEQMAPTLSPESPHSSGLLVALLAVLAVAVTGFAFVLPSVQALISRRSDPAKQGEILGLNQSANAMARILGPFLGVLLYFRSSNHVFPYAFGAGVLLVVLLLTLRMRQV